MAIRITDGATKMLSVRAATSHAVLRHMIGPFLRRAELVGRLEVGSNNRGTYTTLRRKADDGLAPQNATLRCLPRLRKSPFAIYNCFRNSRSALLTSLARSC